MLTVKPRVRIVKVMRILATYFSPRAKQRLSGGLCIMDWLLGVFTAEKKKKMEQKDSLTLGKEVVFKQLFKIYFFLIFI